MPVYGFNQGISAMVGHALGGNREAGARQVTWNGIQLLLVYTVGFDLLILFFPHLLLELFIQPGLPASVHAAILEQGTLLLRIVALYILFDNFYLIFAAALKGAGDTKFILWSTVTATVFCMILPVTVGVTYYGAGLGFVWSCLLLFIASLCLMSYLRFRQDGWLKTRVIDRAGGR